MEIELLVNSNFKELNSINESDLYKEALCNRFNNVINGYNISKHKLLTSLEDGSIICQLQILPSSGNAFKFKITIAYEDELDSHDVIINNDLIIDIDSWLERVVGLINTHEINCIDIDSSEDIIIKDGKIYMSVLDINSASCLYDDELDEMYYLFKFDYIQRHTLQDQLRTYMSR